MTTDEVTDLLAEIAIVDRRQPFFVNAARRRPFKWWFDRYRPYRNQGVLELTLLERTSDGGWFPVWDHDVSDEPVEFEGRHERAVGDVDDGRTQPPRPKSQLGSEPSGRAPTDGSSPEARTSGDDPVSRPTPQENTMTADEWIDPPAGECAFCGHPDKRHRLVDAQMERVAAGEDPDAVADDYDTDTATMVAGWIAHAEWMGGALRWYENRMRQTCGCV